MEGEREGEKHQCLVASHVPLLGVWPTTQACALTGNWTGDPLVRRPALNPLSHSSQAMIFFKNTVNWCLPTYSMGKRESLQQMVVGKLDNDVQKNELEPLSYSSLQN